MVYFLRFVLSFVVVALTAAVSSYLSYLGVNTFYGNLVLPPLNPPKEVFRYVWPVLYVLMIVSFFLILNEKNIQRAIWLFLYQIALHILWCYLFFAKGLFLLGFLCLILLILTVLIMLREFYKLSPVAAYLQYPYLLWLLFAAYLNAGVWYLNGASIAN